MDQELSAELRMAQRKLKSNLQLLSNASIKTADRLNQRARMQLTKHNNVVWILAYSLIVLAGITAMLAWIVRIPSVEEFISQLVTYRNPNLFWGTIKII